MWPEKSNMGTIPLNEESAADWAYLPAHILDSIMDKLFHLPDFIRFAAVCKPWLSAAISNNTKKQNKQKQMPVLLVPSPDSSERRSLYNVSKNKLYNFQLSIPYKKRFCGSSFGWLAAVEEDYTMSLINPFSDVSPITLPRIIRIEELAECKGFEVSKYDYSNMEYDVMKLVLSTDPSLAPDTFEAAAIYGDYLAVAVIKSGDKDWTYIDKEVLRRGPKFLYHKGIDKEVLRRGLDVIYYQGQCHVLDWYNGLKSVVGSTSPQVKIIIPTSEVQIPQSYLVESSTGDLLQVQRFLEPEKGHTTEFKVYKLKHHNGLNPHPEWVEMESIGDDAVFVGDNFSFSLEASKFPGCQPNSIYYTDDFNTFSYGWDPCNMGIFNFEDKRFRLQYHQDPSLPPPIWIVPTLRGKLGLKNQILTSRHSLECGLRNQIWVPMR